RPVQPLINSLTDLGAQGFTTQNNGSPPLVIRGPLKGGNTEIKCHTSQYLSALLITLPLMRQDSVVYTPVLNERPYVEMTLKWLEDMRVYAEVKEGNLFFIGGRHKYKGFGEKQIPADYSSATFLFCAAAITGGSVTVQGLDPEDPQGDKRVLNILAKMGCSVMWDNWDVTVKGGILKGTEIDMNDIPDALPALAVTAAFAEDNTTLYNVEHARLKETDRITAMCQEMRKLGITVDEQTDGLIIFGGKKPTEGTVNSRGDHRIAMAFAIAALGARGPVEIQNAGAVSITYPSFFTVLDQLTGGTAK
ncbi:MAG: 3-phosphoshikimate 1-carboxyvinyltransferase, partial [Spirochaetia bacterium]